MNEPLKNHLAKYAISVISLTFLLWLSYAVLSEFFLVIAWAVIIAYIMWPLYQWLKRKLHNRETASATIMTGLIFVLIMLVIYGFVTSLQGEIKAIYQILLVNFAQSPKQLAESIRHLPWLGDYLSQYLDLLNVDEAGGMKAQLLNWTKQWLGELGKLLGGIGHHFMTLGFILMTLFFCFRDGERVIVQVRLGLSQFLGKYQAIYLRTAGNTAHAVVYGLVLAALGQGLIAGIGYSVAGVNAPALLGAITALLAMIPMGAALVWMPVSLGLILLGNVWHGAGLLLWGIFAISTVDNVIRPLVISGAGRIPFLVVMFGVFGGLKAFGVIGLFLGPIILSVLLAVWKAWFEQQGASLNRF